MSNASEQPGVKTLAELMGWPEGHMHAVHSESDYSRVFEGYPYRIDGGPLQGSVNALPDEQLFLWRGQVEDPELIAMLDAAIDERGLRHGEGQVV